MCNKAVDNYLHTLEFVPKCYKTQKLCDKAVSSYNSRISIFRNCYKFQEMYDEAVNGYFLYLILFLIGVKLKKCVTELFLKILF